jgi:cyclase
MRAAQTQDFSKVEVKSTPLTANLYMLEGAGGNVAALLGSTGALLVDADFGALADKIRAALKADGATAPVRYIINTHYHFDHTDGNLAFAQGGATVIAQANLRTRLASGGTIGGGSISRTVPPADPGALPAITYESELTVYADGTAVRVHHYPNAHTDGDSVVFFADAHVVHMGDIFVRYGFPFIDINGGGNVRGMIAACEDVLSTMPADARVIPGHGAIATLDDLRTYTQMLKDTSALVAKAMTAGKSLEAMQSEKLLGAWSARYSPEKGFVNTETFTELIYRSLARPAARHSPPPRRPYP